MIEGDQVVDIDVRLRGSSPSRRESPRGPSRGGSPQAAGFGFSPALTGRNSHFFGEDFAFDGRRFTPISTVNLPQRDRS